MLYEVQVRGAVDVGHLGEFADVTVADAGAGERGQVAADTLLHCRVRDAAALTGVVALLHDLGVRIVAMRSVPDVTEF
ncbi:hypothetical protein Bcav_0757 [Beutenbergia cavernae DSM 12333]|uniref:Uncharacterized protein n=1 Tax=Beutenbergia cavernae (strain ATCC BAA-8 / DSM 12333 / CCUG 43141 / JCM 11478 / NBRC 16432 / NCIMB 13614 / HKI 0122) TaxID=471853 RepID=C5BYR0_BEUC1|nr:hypothetical protein [Beutenbergia cavernae]ACQ79018.1 hypothetical protein Bcav_0757 [Beutenbergia cavernae DSM 12333]